jgi:polyphosphate kinase
VGVSMDVGLEHDRTGRAEAPPDAEADPTSLYLNRELSWLDFNDRVLQLAEDDRVPLLERVKFCAIYTTNLDEYYMVRVAGLRAGTASPPPRRSP